MWSTCGSHRRIPTTTIQQILLLKTNTTGQGQQSVFSLLQRQQQRRLSSISIPLGKTVRLELYNEDYDHHRKDIYQVQQIFKKYCMVRIRRKLKHDGSLIISYNLIHGLSNPERSYSVHTTSSDKPILPPIMTMSFPPRTWPRFINTIRNWFFTYFVIRPYMDQEFDIQEFNRGAKQAVCLVSEKLTSGEFDDLEGLVEPQALTQIKMTLASFTTFQRELLRVAVDDIFFSFPYQIGIMIPEPVRQEGDKILPQTRHVEITVVFHVLRGFAEKAKTGGDSQTFQDYIKSEDTKYNVMICNYRFFKDFTEGTKNPTWIINFVNHFLPADQIQNNYNNK